MHLEGSCHCGAVRFSVRAPHPVPYNLCYCGVCRKTAGAGGFSINLGAEQATLAIEGRDAIGVYRPGHVDETSGEPSPQERHFCTRCGTALWIHDSRWPELVHPYASAIDTELPAPPQRVHLMLDFAREWVGVNAAPGDLEFPRYPDESLAAWHERHGLTSG